MQSVGEGCALAAASGRLAVALKSTIGISLFGGMMGAPIAEARGVSDISMAALALGRLYVVGTTAEPHTPVTLDHRFHTTSDEAGRFSFEEIYSPVTCIVGINVDARTYTAVVSNCALQTSAGSLPFVRAVFPDAAWARRLSPHRPEAVMARPATLKPKPRSTRTGAGPTHTGPR